MSAVGQKRPPRFVTGTAELASIADAGGHGTRFRVASTRGKAAGPQQAAVPGAGRGASYGPCVDGSGLARVFFTRAAVVGAAMCAVRPFQPSRRAGTRSHSRRECDGFLVALAPGHHCPSHSGHLVGKRDGSNLGGPPR